MKKFIAFMLCALAALCLPLVGCSNNTDGKTVVKVSEVTHSVFYAPMYIAINNGYFDDENLKIELSNAGGADKVITSVISGSAHIGLAGPEATIYCHVQGQRDYPVIFGQLTKRDGSFLVGRVAEPDFEFSSLQGKRILAGRKGGVPAMTLQYVLNTAGVSTNDIKLFDTSVAFDAMVGTFEADKTVDYCTMFEPTASEYVRAGKGYIVASVGSASGEVPYTAFSAKKSYMQKNGDTCKAFLRAVTRGYKFMIENDSATVAAALEDSFVGTSLEALKATVESYVSIDAWASTPVMSETAFNRLQDIMENAGELDDRAIFTDAVDNTLALSVATELGL